MNFYGVLLQVRDVQKIVGMYNMSTYSSKEFFNRNRKRKDIEEIFKNNISIKCQGCKKNFELTRMITEKPKPYYCNDCRK